MREMIRTIEDSQTAQALHGLLSLNAEALNESMATYLQAEIQDSPQDVAPPAVSRSVSSPTMENGWNGQSESPSSMVALSMLLHKRFIAEQKQVAAQRDEKGKKAAAAIPAPPPVGHQVEVLNDGMVIKPEPIDRVIYEPHPSIPRDMQMSNSHPGGQVTSTINQPITSPHTTTSIVTSLLKAPTQISYGSPQLIKSFDSSLTPEVMASLMPQFLAQIPNNPIIAHQVMTYRPDAIGQPKLLNQSVIVPNTSLDLRKVNRSLSDEYVSRSPIKKRPYTMYDEMAPNSNDAPSDKRSKGAIAMENVANNYAINLSLPRSMPDPATIYVQAPPAQAPPHGWTERPSSDDHTAVVMPFVKNAAATHSRADEDSKLSVSLVSARLQEAFTNTFILSKSLLPEMELRLHEWRKECMESMVDKIVVEQLRTARMFRQVK